MNLNDYLCSLIVGLEKHRKNAFCLLTSPYSALRGGYLANLFVESLWGGVFFAHLGLLSKSDFNLQGAIFKNKKEN